MRTLWSAVLLLLAGCAGPALTAPTDLPVTTYAADQAFSLTFVMRTCSSSCATYSPAECTVKVDGQTIDVEISVPYEVTSESCDLVCGPPVLAHCPGPSLKEGAYLVKVGTFERQINVRPIASGS